MQETIYLKLALAKIHRSCVKQGKNNRKIQKSIARCFQKKIVELIVLVKLCYQDYPFWVSLTDGALGF